MNSVATGRGPLSPSRDEILAVLEAGMRPDPGVHAMWIDEHPLVIFDRDGTLRFEHADEDALAAELRERVGQLREDFSLFRSWMTKALGRGDFLEAMGYYQLRLMPTLVELLRIRFAPTKRDYYVKRAGRDLPPDVAARLAELYRLTSVEEIAARVPLAVALFEETLAALGGPAH